MEAFFNMHISTKGDCINAIEFLTPFQLLGSGSALLKNESPGCAVCPGSSVRRRHVRARLLLDFLKRTESTSPGLPRLLRSTALKSV